MDSSSSSRRPAHPPSRAEKINEPRCTPASAEKYAIAVSEVWKNERGQYSDLRPQVTPYDRIKAEGLLATISAKRYQQVATALGAAPVDGWRPAFHQWLLTFRAGATEYTRARGSVAPAFEEFTRDLERSKARLHDREEELEWREGRLHDREVEMDDWEAELEEREADCEQRELLVRQQHERQHRGPNQIGPPPRVSRASTIDNFRRSIPIRH
ncbi:hypothetical protein ACJ73_10060 [Blastomyces percursus]|uniref:Uncharacterized protein n=1 Tax=Blastomyces percursus TaxID=1658174 RepID=A0A1J9Q3U7_9EURO|nr:hypothetical protein ACJ73_10060 [Blastomyces percursus]